MTSGIGPEQADANAPRAGVRETRARGATRATASPRRALDLQRDFSCLGQGSRSAIHRRGDGWVVRPEPGATLTLRSDAFELPPFARLRLALDLEPIGARSDAPLAQAVIRPLAGSPFDRHELVGPAELDLPAREFALARAERTVIELHVREPILVRRIELIDDGGVLVEAPDAIERVSVVIVTYERVDAVTALLEALFAGSWPRWALDVVVVDNASTDGTVERLRARFGDAIEVVETGANLGGSGGFNAGMAHVQRHHANGYVWLLDNDVVVARDALERLVEALRALPDAGAVGSAMLRLDDQAIVNEAGGAIDWERGRIRHERPGAHVRRLPREPQRVEFCAAASLLVRRRVIEQIGRWDDVFIHFDDVEWCLRMAAAGWRVYCQPRSLIWHESAGVKQTTWVRYYDVRNLLGIYRRYAPRLLRAAVRRYRLHARYFRWHRHRRTAALIDAAIDASHRGETGRAEAVAAERLRPLRELDAARWPAADVAVFADAGSLARAAAELPRGFFLGATAFLYDAERDDVGDRDDEHSSAREPDPTPAVARIVRRPRGQLGRLAFYARQWLATAWPRRRVVFDGAFERQPMVPPVRAALYVWPRFATFVDTRV